MQAAISEKEQMESLLVGLDKVLYIINRCKIYEMLYPRNLKLDKAGQNLEAALITLYILVLQFLSAAIKVYKQNTETGVFKSFWPPDCIADFEKDFQELTEHVDIEAQNCKHSYSKIKHTEQQKALQRLLDEITKMKDMEEKIHRMDVGVATIWSKLNASERDGILTWVSNISYKDHHSTAREGRTKGTGDWLLEHEQYKKWETSDESTILWLHGIRKC